MRPELLPALVVAYLGDSVFEVYVREYLICERGIMKPVELQKEAIRYVSAMAQSSFMDYAIENGQLSEEEIGIYKRGRNVKGRKPTNMSVTTHNKSSGFETLIGHLYLKEDKERLQEIFELYKKYINEEDL